jgi:hypothetical protein
MQMSMKKNAQKLFLAARAEIELESRPETDESETKV